MEVQHEVQSAICSKMRFLLSWRSSAMLQAKRIVGTGLQGCVVLPSTKTNAGACGLSMRSLSTTNHSAGDGSGFNAQQTARTLKLLERRKVTTLDIGILKRKNKPITMVTAYDYPSAVHVDLAGFDVLLVGDSLGMVELVRLLAMSAVHRPKRGDLCENCNG